MALRLRLTYCRRYPRAILEGRQPGDFTAQKLVTYSALPFAWPEQRMRSGSFDGVKVRAREWPHSLEGLHYIIGDERQ